jgi:hypothetical protein
MRAGGGQLAVLQWARAHGCPWNKETCTRVAKCPATMAWIGAQS